MGISYNRTVLNAETDRPPLAFDWSIYVNHPYNKDLSGFNASQATHHYNMFGREEGRIAGQIDGRSSFLRLVPNHGTLLEIGPFCTPCFSASKRRVRFLDAFSTDELRVLAAKWSWGKPGDVPDIDYVWRGGCYADLIDERFNAVFSSHNIEHQPCLIAHLRSVASVLLPGMRLFLTIPDHRYCFDHYLPQSTIADVLDAYLDGRRRHTARSVIEHDMLLTHNESSRHWNRDHGPDPRLRPPDRNLISQIAEHLKNLQGMDNYIDAHAWQFTPESFSHLVGILNVAGLIAFEIEQIYPTLRPSNEFYAVLRLPAEQ